MLPSWFSLELAYELTDWACRLIALAVVPLRRRPAASAGWLLLIMFLPIPGMIAFAIIGSPRFPAARVRRFQLLTPYFDKISQRLTAHAPPAAPSPFAQGPFAPVFALAQHLGHFPPVSGNAVRLIDDYDGMLEQLAADIRSARHYVLILVYIFADDPAGRLIAAALRDAAARGVDCRVMIDPVGSHRWRRAVGTLLDEAGVETRWSLPFHLIRGRTRRDMRNHRKLFVIDGRIGYAGSQNIVDKSFRPGVVNRELVARVEGPLVAEMEAVIRGDWFMETGTLPADDATPAPHAGETLAQLLPSGAAYPLEGFESLLVWQIHSAVERVVLVTPYFIPDDGLVGAMRTAVARGVRVDVVISAVVDQRLVNLAQCSYYDELLGCGIGIHAYRDALLHAKNVSIDGRLAIVGSSNVDLRSFELNEEASLLLYGGPAVDTLIALQAGYIENSMHLDLVGWRQRPSPRRFAENLARLISPLL